MPRLGHAAHGVHERVHVAHSLLEQVADARRVVADQVVRVGLLAVRREHQDAELGLVGAQLHGRAQAVVRALRRHLHVDDRDIRLVRTDLADEVVRVARARDDVEPGIAQQAGDAFAHEHVVLTDDDAQGCTFGADGGDDTAAVRLAVPRCPARGAGSGTRPIGKGADMTVTTDHHPTLRHVDREAIGTELQAILAVLTDLALTGKHAHWNVQGPNFRSLHLQLDELVDAWRDAADEVAERAVALGHAPDGRIATMAAQTPLPALEAGPQHDA